MGEAPAISVVMGVCNDADILPETLASVLAQTERDFEFIVVDDGSSDPRVGEILADVARRDARLRVVTKSNEGLTRALIDGCAAARGTYVARIDAGDVMAPDRLARQKAVLDAHPDVVLVTCWTEFCGPEWEPLYVERGAANVSDGPDGWIAPATFTAAEGYLVNGPTSHPSVMFRLDTYRAAGGYRWQFYYGQDGDLWGRLAERGPFAGVPAVLYRCRVFPEGLSMRNGERQRRLHQCLFGAIQARRAGASEEPHLQAAAAIRPPPRPAGAPPPRPRPRAEGWYFVGERLRRNGDPRAAKYFREACRRRPWGAKNWLRLLQCVRLAGCPAPQEEHHA